MLTSSGLVVEHPLTAGFLTSGWTVDGFPFCLFGFSGWDVEKNEEVDSWMICRFWGGVKIPQSKGPHMSVPLSRLINMAAAIAFWTASLDVGLAG